MKFHRRAPELLGALDLPLDRARSLAVAHLAEVAGVALPAAVAEWYSLPTSSPVWRTFNRNDESILRCNGEDPARRWFGRPLGRDESTCTPWAVPPVCYDLRGWVPDPVLPLMGECCGGWWWGVALTGAADPPVVITHDEGETWDWGGTSFSGYVYGALFDALCEGPQECAREVRLEGHRLDGPERRRIREEFRVEPATRVPYPFASDLRERYAREGQRVSVCNREVPVGSRHRPDSEWRLWAASEEEFRDLVGRLSRLVPEFALLTHGRYPVLSIAPGLTATGVTRPECDESDIPF